MKVRFTRLHWVRTFLRWAFACCFCMAAIRTGQSPLHAEIPPEPDEYVIVSDEGDVAPADDATDADAAEESEPTADEAEPREMPTEDEPSDNDAADNDAADNDAAADEAEYAAEELSDEDAADAHATDDVAPIGGPAPGVPTPAKPEGAEPEEVGDEETVGTIRPAAKAKSAEATAAESDESATDDDNSKEADSRPAVEGASFKSVLPSVTTEEEMKSAWGPAKEVRKSESGMQHVYYTKPFKQVVVTVVAGKVDTILIRLDKQFEPKVLAKQLMLDDVEPATILNAKGQMLGMAFPERGVLFGFAAGLPVRVGQIVLEPINSQPFVTRAEKNYRRKPAAALVDADYAIEIDPTYDRAHAVKARVLMQLGQFELALTAIEKALSLMPDESEHQLTKANLLVQLQRYPEAKSLVDALATDRLASPLVRAWAEKVRGDLLSVGPERKFDLAIKHHSEAIQRAEKVSTASAGNIRRAAKELLVEAHVAVAHDIAWGNWQQKSKVVPQWIDRATSFCDNLIEKDFGEDCIRLRLLEKSLGAYAGMKDAPEVTETVDAMTRLGRTLASEPLAPGQSEVMQWQLGEALSSAMAVCQQQEKFDAATQLGQQALACFKKAGKFGSRCPDSDFVVGQVFYRLGAIQAVHRSAHAKAVVWYDEAVPLLEKPTPPRARPELGRTGEMFVSMAVTYWEVDKREEAVRLTQQGANLMESAVKQYGFPQEAMSVPYGNLANMHAGMGHDGESKKFAEMAAKADTVRR